jgi:hypothetical protein
MEQLWRRRYSQRYHMTLKVGVKKKKTKDNSIIGKGGSYFNTIRRNIQDTTFGNRFID